MKYMIKIMPVLFLALMLAGPVSVAAAQKENGIETDLEDGEYSIQVDLEGGSGKASVSSPTLMLVKNGRMYAELQWSSSRTKAKRAEILYLPYQLLRWMIKWK